MNDPSLDDARQARREGDDATLVAFAHLVLRRIDEGSLDWGQEDE